MNAPVIPASWLPLIGPLTVETAFLTLLAALIARWSPSASWRRTIWQAALVALSLLGLSELLGLRPLLAGRQPLQSRESRFAVRSNLPVNAGASTENQGVSGTATTPAAAIAREAKPLQTSAWPAWLWLTGFGLVAGRAVFSRILLTTARWRWRSLTNEAVLRQHGALAGRLGLRRPVRLVLAPGLSGPVAFGWLSPVVAVPQSFESEYSPAQQQTMLAHELAHLAGHDPFWHGLADLLVAGLWWHPLVWWARRQWRAASESVADEASLCIENGPVVLAECLVRLGQRLRPRPVLGWLGIEGGGFRSGLGQRVHRLMHLHPARCQPANGFFSRLTLGLAPVMTVALLLAVSAWAVPSDGRQLSLAVLLQHAFEPASPDSDTPPGSSESHSAEVPTASEMLTTRFFRLDPNTVLENLVRRRGLGASTITPPYRGDNQPPDTAMVLALRQYLTEAGVDLGEPILNTVPGATGPDRPVESKAWFYQDRTGVLVVRATRSDHEIIEQALGALQRTPPQVMITAKFIEMSEPTALPIDIDSLLATNALRSGLQSAAIQHESVPTLATNWFGAAALPPTNLSLSWVTGPNAMAILSDPQSRLVLKTLEQSGGADILSAPRVTTLSERQFQIQSTEQRVIVDGSLQSSVPGQSTQLDDGTLPPAKTIPLGVTLDVIPVVLTNGYTIRLTAICTVTEFLGYASSEETSSTKSVTPTGQVVIRPIPKIRVRQIQANADVWDGQTLVLFGPAVEMVLQTKDKVPVLGDLPMLGALFRREGTQKSRKRMVVFITPVLVDPAGNRVHTDDNLPFDPNTVPAQSRSK